jgi:hypothetical protein
LREEGSWGDGEVFAVFGHCGEVTVSGSIGEVREDHGRGLDAVEEESGASAIDAVLGDGVQDFLERDHQGVGVFDERHEDVGVGRLLGWRRGTTGAACAGRVVPVTEVGVAERG